MGAKESDRALKGERVCADRHSALPLLSFSIPKTHLPEGPLEDEASNSCLEAADGGGEPRPDGVHSFLGQREGLTACLPARPPASPRERKSEKCKREELPCSRGLSAHGSRDPFSITFSLRGRMDDVVLVSGERGCDQRSMARM